MEWTQFGIFILTMGGLFLWNRSEANNDRRMFQADLKEFREKWAEESKEFHGRLVDIEKERNKILLGK